MESKDGDDGDGDWIKVNRRRQVQFNKGKETNWSKESRVDWRRSMPSIYIGNIQKPITKEGLREFFSRYGRVTDIFVAGQARNFNEEPSTFGFIRFQHEETVNQILRERDSFTLEGVVMPIRKAKGGDRDGNKGNRLGVKGSKTGYTGNQELVRYRARTYAQVVRNGNGTMEDSRKREEHLQHT